MDRVGIDDSGLRLRPVEYVCEILRELQVLRAHHLGLSTIHAGQVQNDMNTTQFVGQLLRMVGSSSRDYHELISAGLDRTSHVPAKESGRSCHCELHEFLTLSRTLNSGNDRSSSTVESKSSLSVLCDV